MFPSYRNSLVNWFAEQQKQPLELFYKKTVIKNFGIFTGKHLCWSLFLIKLQAFKPLLRNETPVQVFCRQIFKNIHFEKHLWTATSRANQLTGFYMMKTLSLTCFIPLLSFYTPWKHQKSRGFLMFLRDIERDQWDEVGY